MGLAFVRKKQTGRYHYFQLVESRRVDGKPRQKVLAHLGNHATVDEALKKWPNDVKRLRRNGHDEAANALEVKLGKLRKLRSDGAV
jgi:hypothetical protein